MSLHGDVDQYEEPLHEGGIIGMIMIMNSHEGSIGQCEEIDGNAELTGGADMTKKFKVFSVKLDNVPGIAFRVGSSKFKGIAIFKNKRDAVSFIKLKNLKKVLRRK
jgi:hypothetical protein